MARYAQLARWGFAITRKKGSIVSLPPVVPNILAASGAWTGTANSGMGVVPIPTESGTLYGSGWEFKAVLNTTIEPMAYMDDDSRYFMIAGGGDPVNMGPCTFEVTYEGAQATFTQADYQWDPVDGIYGVPVKLRPNGTHNGIGRVHVKVKPTNGFERLLTYDVWQNQNVGGTGYKDRHANAIYVSGDYISGSAHVAGTNTTTVGTSANPNNRINYALSFATAGGAREGCFIYVRGSVKEDLGTASGIANTYPNEVRPWPGYATADTHITKTDRITNSGASGGWVSNNWRVVFKDIRLNPNNFIRLGTGNTASAGLGFDNVEFTGLTDGELDIYGFPTGNVLSIGGVTSNSFFNCTGGQYMWARNCSGTLVSGAGLTMAVNNSLAVGWDATFFGNVNSNVGYWNHRVSQPTNARARFHNETDLTVASISYASNWCEIAFSGSPTLIDGAFELFVTVLTGALAGTQIGQAGLSTGLYSAPITNGVLLRALSGSSPYSTYPNQQRLYVALRDLAVEGLQVGDKLRVWNIHHADAFQFGQATAGVAAQPTNYYFQGYTCVGQDIQGVFLQPGFAAGVGTVTTSGTTATFSSSQTLQPGMGLQLNAGSQRYEWAQIVSGSGTTWTLDRAFSVDQTVGVAFAVGNRVQDVLWENCIIDKVLGTDEQAQINYSLRHATFLYCSFKGTNYDTTSANGWAWRTNASVTPFAAQGFALGGVVMRHNLFHQMLCDVQVDFTTAFTVAKGITLDRNHFWLGTARGTNTSSGNPTFNSTGSLTSGYLATAAGVQTVDTVHVKYDRRGNLRQVGHKIGPVVA